MTKNLKMRYLDAKQKANPFLQVAKIASEWSDRKMKGIISQEKKHWFNFFVLFQFCQTL